MRTPEFWYAPIGGKARLLAPAAALYRAGASIRRALTRPRRLAVPALCVGNLVAGGAGKTPTVIALASLLQDAGFAPHILSRGWGGRLAGPVRVDPLRHSSLDVGDEPLLLAAAAPCWIARDRHGGARAAAAAGAKLLLLDDGLQNPTLAPEFRLLVIDGASGIGNGRVLPAGPLREEAASGMARADAVVMIDRDQTGFSAHISVPVIAARLEPAPAAELLKGERVLGFAGIGQPEKFFATLRELGCTLVESVPFADHHRYRPEEIMALVERAVKAKARLVTTEKDWVRLPLDARKMAEAVPVALAFADEAALLHLIAPLLARVKPAAADQAPAPDRAAAGTS
ncbi:MAG: tetraacyldisaccharide 4'-kinase [Alphaproteobacteria bacterium]|nr:tetraacyldisaccharide 4'-kinase [Alphaproteobacteria bacterium]